MISSTLMMKIRKNLEQVELSVPWMNLDSAGLITVGCGTMLPSDSAAAEIPFFHKNAGKPATVAEIKAAWQQLHRGSAAQKTASSSKKFNAKHYEKETDLRISRSVVDLRRDHHIQADYQQLQAIYPEFDDFPEPAKLALFDMIYNVGPGQNKDRHHRASGLRKFVHLNAAVRKRDWATASKCCMRHGISFERNRATAKLFESCILDQSLASQHAQASL